MAATVAITSVIVGATADRPAAGVKGRLYVHTDDVKLSYDDGSTWTDVTASGSSGAPTTAKYVVTEADGTLSAEVLRQWLGNTLGPNYPTSPDAMNDEFDDTTNNSGTNNGLDAQWSWRNQDTSSVTFEVPGWITMNCQAQATANWRIIEQATIADGTYDCYVSVKAVETDEWYGGMVMVDSVNGDFYFFGLASLTNDDTRLIVQRWNSVTSFNSTLFNADIPAFQNAMYLRFVKSGTTFDFWASVDGVGWVRLITFTDAVTPTRIGLGVNQTINNAANHKVYFDFFRKTA